MAKEILVSLVNPKEKKFCYAMLPLLGYFSKSACCYARFWESLCDVTVAMRALPGE